MVLHEALTIIEVISKSSLYLERKGVATPKTDVEWLVAYALGCKRMELYLRYGEVLPESILDQIRNLITKRGKRIPLQHILGEVHFAGLKIKSDHRALIPRFETEFLVDYLYHKFSSDFKGKIADLGCGGGAIILGLCSLMPNTRGVGFDYSTKALSLARDNLTYCKLENRVSFRKFNWLNENSLSEKFNLIVCNPPYLSKEEWNQTEPEVRLHDPVDALISDKEGLADIENVVSVCSKSLATKGYIALEFGMSQADTVKKLFPDEFQVEIIADQFLVRRFALAHRK